MHWVYIWLPHPLGLVVTWRLVTYVGETNHLIRRSRQHLATSWWRWLVWPVPLALPMPRWVAMHVERGLVQLLAPAANREYNSRRALRPGAVTARLLVVLAAVTLVLMAWMGLR